MAANSIKIEDHKLRILRGAVCEYLDEECFEEFTGDLRKILEEEEGKFQKMADNYKKIRRELFSK